MLSYGIHLMSRFGTMKIQLAVGIYITYRDGIRIAVIIE